jgi:hypothetical protein
LVNTIGVALSVPSQSHIKLHGKLTLKSSLSNFGNASSVVVPPALPFCNPAVQVSRLRSFLMPIDKASEVTRSPWG